MRYMSHDEIRNMWFDFFKKKGHKVLESASLVPSSSDKSLLWTNAGVTPLKKYFDGSEVPECRRLTSIQKCIRTNDIENVGLTKRHQTFFEMMGNFSVGDYFKNEAIEWSFELLTSPKYFDMDPGLLYVTIYTDDDDAYNKWVEVGLSPEHIIRLKDNFWEIGEGPCGPDSEIFFDRGEKYDTDGRALEHFKRDEEQERYVEIWNNVFSQFNAKEGVERENYKELPSKNIDTGAGLERWCCILQGVDSNFETDLFKPIIQHISELANKEYNGDKEYKIIADHIRAIVFALADGAFFGNVGRSYVLRRLLRRSMRFGKNLGIELPFMYKIVSDVVDAMGNAYPYLREKRPVIEALVLEEEKLFLKTLDTGEKRLQELINNSLDKTISGEDVFKLYDTYGFPYEFTVEYLDEVGYSVSREEFDKYMEAQKELAKKNNKNKASMASQKKVLLDFKDKSEFLYNTYKAEGKVIAIFSKDEIVKSIDHDSYIALDKTPFYAESGGQVSDTGMIIGDNFKARVIDLFKAPNGQHIHKVKLLDGVIKIGDKCELIVDEDRRKRIEVNHSSVHVLQYALQQVISKDITQAGSYVDDERFRFDFTYNGKMYDEKLVEVEEFARKMVDSNTEVITEVMPIDEARKLGAMALFDEKYGDMVRVVKIGESLEFCGGTHTSNTSNIKNFTIVSCESKGSNVYRIEGATACYEAMLEDAIKPYRDEKIKLLNKAKNILAEALKDNIKLDLDLVLEDHDLTSYNDVIYNRNELLYIQQEVKALEKKYYDLKEKNSLNDLTKYQKECRDLDGNLAIIMKTKRMDNNILKAIADSLVDILNPGVVFFANIKEDNTVNFIARSNNPKVNVGLIVKSASVMALGNGGGKDSFAQGGGKDISKLDKIFEMVESSIRDAK